MCTSHQSRGTTSRQITRSKKVVQRGRRLFSAPCLTSGSVCLSLGWRPWRRRPPAGHWRRRNVWVPELHPAAHQEGHHGGHVLHARHQVAQVLRCECGPVRPHHHAIMLWGRSCTLYRESMRVETVHLLVYVKLCTIVLYIEGSCNNTLQYVHSIPRTKALPSNKCQINEFVNSTRLVLNKWVTMLNVWCNMNTRHVLKARISHQKIVIIERES